MATIPDSHRDLLDRPITVTLVTVMPDGHPQATPVWCNYDGTYVKVNSARGRQKVRNMDRDPRVTILAIDPDDDGRWIEVRGLVQDISEDGAADHIDELSLLYTNELYYGGRHPMELKNAQVRVIYRIKPVHVSYDG
jgi:PPOX class probable F420-dependent enzyme